MQALDSLGAVLIAAIAVAAVQWMTRGQFARLRSDLRSELRTEISAQTEHLDGRITELGIRAERTEGRVERVEGRVQHVESQMTEIRTDLRGLRASIDAMWTELTRIALAVGAEPKRNTS